MQRIGEHWLPAYEEDGRDNSIRFLIGAKYDMREERKVSELDAKKFKNEHNMRKYYEISSLSGHGVDSLFQTMAAYILKYQPHEVALSADRIALHEYKMSEPGSVKGSSRSCPCLIL